jgi:beta-galactosidase
MRDEFVEHLFNLDTAFAAARGRPMWQAELQGGRGRRDVRSQTPHPRPESTSLWMWNALAAGASGIVFWQWRPELLGPESPGYGLTTPAGDPTLRLEAVSGFASVAGLADLAGRRPDEPHVALLVSRRTALLAYASDKRMDIYRDAVMGAYQMLIDLDLPVLVMHEDVVERDGLPSHIDRVIWPMPSVASAPLASALTAFVKKGGRLVTEALPGEYGSDGRRQTIAPGFGLAELLGVREIEPDSDMVDIELEGLVLRGAWQRALVNTTAEVLGTFVDGMPGVTSRRYGNGVAVHIGTYPSVAYARDAGQESRIILGRLLDQALVPRPVLWVTPRVGLVGRGATTRDGRRLGFALNWTSDDAEAAVDFVAQAISVTDPRGVALSKGATIEVPPKSGVLFVESPAAPVDDEYRA